MRKALSQHSVEFTVPFHDTDAMQVVWHGNYLKYFEIAKDALFAELGLDLVGFFTKTGFLFPVIRTTTKHIFPLRYSDRFRCTASMVECRRKIAVDFEIRLVDDDTLCARGTCEQVAVRSDDFCLQLSIPEEIRRVLEG